MKTIITDDELNSIMLAKGLFNERKTFDGTELYRVDGVEYRRLPQGGFQVSNGPFDARPSRAPAVPAHRAPARAVPAPVARAAGPSQRKRSSIVRNAEAAGAAAAQAFASEPEPRQLETIAERISNANVRAKTSRKPGLLEGIRAAAAKAIEDFDDDDGPSAA